MPGAARFAVPAARVYLAQHALYAFGFALYATYSAVRRVVDLGFDPFELVLVGTVLEASVFLLEIPTGVVADVRGRRRSVTIGYAVIGIGFALEAASTGLLGVLAAQALWGGGWTFVSGARSAWLADEVGESAAAPLYLRAAQVSRVAALLGIAASAALASVDLVLPVAAGAGALLLLAVATPLVMSETGYSPRSPEPGRQWQELGRTFVAGLREARRHGVVAVLGVVGLFAGAWSEAFDRLWQLHLIELSGDSLPALFGLDPLAWFAVLPAAALLLSLPILEAVRRLGRRSGEGPLLAGLFVLLFVFGAVFALAGGFAVAVAAWLVVSALRGALGPLESGWANRRLRSEVRATVLSMLGQADALGQTLGGPGIGYLGRVLGVRAALCFGAALLLPGLGLLVGARRREAPDPPTGA